MVLPGIAERRRSSDLPTKVSRAGEGRAALVPQKRRSRGDRRGAIRLPDESSEGCEGVRRRRLPATDDGWKDVVRSSRRRGSGARNEEDPSGETAWIERRSDRRADDTEGVLGEAAPRACQTALGWDRGLATEHGDASVEAAGLDRDAGSAVRRPDVGASGVDRGGLAHHSDSKGRTNWSSDLWKAVALCWDHRPWVAIDVAVSEDVNEARICAGVRVAAEQVDATAGRRRMRLGRRRVMGGRGCDEAALCKQQRRRVYNLSLLSQ